MKKNLFTIAMAIITLVSCSKEEFFNVLKDNKTINASFENISNTKVAVGQDNTLSWSTDDKFVILDAQGGAGFYTLSSNSGSTNATFTGTPPSGTIKGAAFPFTDISTLPSLSGNTLTMTLPAEISFEEGICNSPMWAAFGSSNMQTISFKHLVSMLKVDLSGIPATAGQIIVDATKPIAGKFTANIDQTGDDLILRASSDATNSITINFTPSSQISQRLFLIPIPAGTYDSFSIAYANADGSGKTFLKSWSNLVFNRAVPNKATVNIGNLDAELNSDYGVDGNTYTINTVVGLFWFAEEVNSGNTFEGKTVVLNKNIDLNNVTWTPIGTGSKKYFRGTFDGNDKTISNLVVDCSATENPAGLFGYVPDPAIIKDLNISQVNIVAQKYAGAVVGKFEENGKSRATIQNCSVNGGSITASPAFDGSKYDNGNHVGGITGYASKNVTIENCSVKNLTLTAYKDMGGISGTTTGKTSQNQQLYIKNSTVDNVLFVQDLKNGYEANVPKTVGDIVGRIVNDALTTEINTASNIKMTVKAYSNADAQGALDLANTPRTIQLAAGNYGILYLRWNDAAEVITNSNWAGGNCSYKRAIEGLTIEGTEGTNMVSLVTEAGTYLGEPHSLSSIHNNLETIILIKDLKIKGITFNTGINDIAVKIGQAGQHTSINGLTIDNCTVNGTTASNDKSRLFVSQQETPVSKYGINIERKNITIKNCKLNDLYQGFEIIYIENLTVEGNVFNKISDRDMLFSGSDAVTGPIGRITITGNKSDYAGNRFIRMARLNGTLTVTNNIVTNYQGSDNDIVKIDGTRSGAIILFEDNDWMGLNDTEAKAVGIVKY